MKPVVPRISAAAIEKSFGKQLATRASQSEKLEAAQTRRRARATEIAAASDIDSFPQINSAKLTAYAETLKSTKVMNTYVRAAKGIDSDFEGYFDEMSISNGLRLDIARTLLDMPQELSSAFENLNKYNYLLRYEGFNESHTIKNKDLVNAAKNKKDADKLIDKVAGVAQLAIKQANIAVKDFAIQIMHIVSGFSLYHNLVAKK